MMCVRRHVLGTRHVHAAPADISWHASVWLRAQLASSYGGHLLDRIEDDLRSNRAIQAHHVGTESVERLSEIFYRYAVRRVTIGADRHLRNDGDVRVHFACRENSLLDLVKIGERLEYEQIAAAVLQCLELLAKHRSRLIQAGGPERLETNAEWTNCARDKQI